MFKPLFVADANLLQLYHSPRTKILAFKWSPPHNTSVYVEKNPPYAETNQIWYPSLHSYDHNTIWKGGSADIHIWQECRGIGLLGIYIAQNLIILPPPYNN